ncbi:TolC family protein [Erythrobacter dokdonensis]|uniref:Outer membrane efflux protein n=1 Tax=Erythrobacter dokdonensis DSW-74 TaxID=1300349 RepID=A0A1A7BL78_9SPHN|nr:TolC family protein [Erythrobacter dokdonensis]OBV12237.1 Outer membrane efflux protein [Erythrobacter dokdonensis DSW-74]
MIRRLILFTSLAAMLAAPLAADPGLPPPEAVERALAEHPSVTAARARLEAARARSDALRKGPYEFTVQGSHARRSVSGGNEFPEYDAQLSRPIRLPGKARLDRAIGQYGTEVAENVAEDARHEAALLLAAHWFDWLAASAQARVDRAAVANYEAGLAAVTRRRSLRDAAQLEVDQAEAALAEARRALEQSSGLAALARTRLETHFPALALPVDAPEVPMPDMADARLSQLGDLVIVNSHLIAAAEAESARMAAVADRARADRFADPTVGLRLFSEFGGIERGAGVVVSLPLGGGHRKALASEARAGASAAQADEQLARFEVSETARSDVTEARFRILTWQRSRDSVAAQMAALEKLRRGHQLGEIDLADLLLGERMVHDAFRIEAEARTEAMRAITRLRIDAHDLWLAD